MAEVIWAEPALKDIMRQHAGWYRRSSRMLIASIIPDLLKPQELKGWCYRQILEPPCRVYYSEDSGQVLILHAAASRAPAQARTT
jgi:hypothetical protein